jgi:hypothetical protein
MTSSQDQIRQSVALIFAPDTTVFDGVIEALESELLASQIEAEKQFLASITPQKIGAILSLNNKPKRARKATKIQATPATTSAYTSSPDDVKGGQL